MQPIEFNFCISSLARTVSLQTCDQRVVFALSVAHVPEDEIKPPARLLVAAELSDTGFFVFFARVYFQLG